MQRMLLFAVVTLCSCGARSSGDGTSRPPDSAPSSAAPKAGALSAARFHTLMNTVSEGWNGNDARKAADCFTENALYSAPPSPRIRRGRAALYEFFGGARGRPRPMKMQWHHLVFDEATQIGAGEYTFEYEVRTHGVAMVRIVDGKIANWREYEFESTASWKEAVGENGF